jgi:hypothetical protein
MAIRTRIIDVERKPSKCPVCGGEVVDIIYGTGDMTEIDFLFAYRKSAIMGGDNIPRRPPIWACMCGCKRFRKVNPDGSDASVKEKLLKNVRKGSLNLFIIETQSASDAMMADHFDMVKTYKAEFKTNCGEKDSIHVTAVSEVDAKSLLMSLLSDGCYRLKGTLFESLRLTLCNG